MNQKRKNKIISHILIKRSTCLIIRYIIMRIKIFTCISHSFIKKKRLKQCISHTAYYDCLCFKRLIYGRQYNRSLYVESIDYISFATGIAAFFCLHFYRSTLVNRPMHSSRHNHSLQYTSLFTRVERLIFLIENQLIALGLSLIVS